MAESNYKPNSHRSKELLVSEQNAEKRMKNEPVVSGKARVKKRSAIEKATESIIANDISNIGSSIMADVVMPSVKKLLCETGKTFLEMLFYGERRSDGRGYISYEKEYDKHRGEYKYRKDPSRSGGLAYENIEYETLQDAKRVFDSMWGSIYRYGTVSVMDLYEFSRIPNDNYMLSHFGWNKDTFKFANIVGSSDGYYRIKLPKAMPFDEN